MLPPDTAVMWVTFGKIPASRRNLTKPRWYNVARNPPPDSARPIFIAVRAPSGRSDRQPWRDSHLFVAIKTALLSLIHRDQSCSPLSQESKPDLESHPTRQISNLIPCASGSWSE